MIDAEMIKADLLSLDTRDFYIKYIVKSKYWYFSDYLEVPGDEVIDVLDRFKEIVSEHFHISFHSLQLVGSAKTGFSLSPNKILTPFHDGDDTQKSSDIDIAIISESLYQYYWNKMRQTEKIQYKRFYQQLTASIFRGYINDKVLMEIPPIRTEWLSVVAPINKLLQDELMIVHPITYRIYRSWEDLDAGFSEPLFSPEGSKPKTASVPDSAKIRCNLPKIMLYCLLLCFLCGILSEQLRILGSPACLEPCRAKPTGAGGPVRSKSSRWSIIMNQNPSVRKLVRCGVVAAIYVVLCMALQPLSYGAVQVRVAEALCLLPVFGAEYIAGVVLGCFLANLLGSTIVDVIFGTLATLLACLVTYKLRNIRFKGLAVAASLPPVLFNAVIIGIEIAVMFPDPTSSAPIWLACITNGISVGIGELISCTVLGVLLVKIIESSKALRKIFAA